jgi:peptide chain release factor 1
MFDKLQSIEARYQEIEAIFGNNAPDGDFSKVVALAQERSEIEPIVEAYRQYRRVAEQHEDARKMVFEEKDPDLYAMAQEEMKTLGKQLEVLESELKAALLTKDPRDEKNVIVEIRAGTGGDEAGLFAGDLLRMYTRYAEARRWAVEVMSESESGINGYSQVVINVRGKGAYSKMKYESGVHRVQRVPLTENQGRIHTSTATVAVMAEVDEIEIHIDPKDVQIDVHRSQGAGGQSVNRTDSAVRMTHLPTGIVVNVQDERRQLQNKIKAMNILRARLFELEMNKRKSEEESTRRSQIGSGERSEKIRTYNYPQNRVTDHRIGITSYNLPAVMAGDLDRFIDELFTREQAERLGIDVAVIAQDDD